MWCVDLAGTGEIIEPIFRRADKQTCRQPVQAETLFFKIYFMVFLFYFNIYIVQVAWWCFLSFGGGSKFKQVFLET